MLNYIKSELYRVFYSRTLYITLGAMAAIVTFLNVALYMFSKTDPGFKYGTVSFSLSNIVASPMIYLYLGAMISMFLYESNRKNGTLKNTIAFGISRVQIFIGECLVSLIGALFVFLILFPLYIGEALLLLEHTGPVGVKDMFTEAAAVSFIGIAGIISIIVIHEVLEGTMKTAIVWLGIWSYIPTILHFVGLKVESISWIARWMPENFFKTDSIVNTKVCQLLWDTPEGMMKCFVVGVVGIVIFSGLGILLLRKKEV